ncbi:hypothetical protein THRCLA_03124 [Thraustotheca clavata]|uniref:WRKY19-like zinc finger domain-containing protein n=1 Tax=Thraustotheca clavata TaxID=74557 RepID=A0A1W0A303_9STRA|nr:hypothetical protein THRCLA_03124 [Thraustotheca clavata]
MNQCCFNSCGNPARPNSDKCDFHRNRRRCIIEGCTNQVLARQRCVRHGGKPLCSHFGCTANARTGGVCSRHGAALQKRVCSVDGCSRIAHRKLLCIRHGGGRQCNIQGCSTHARSGGCENPCRPNSDKCHFHRNRRTCVIEGCPNQVFARQRCVRHGGKPLCSHNGCTANARTGGVCSRHGAALQKRVCSVACCSRVAHRKFLCIRHGGGRQCHVQDCATHARSGGYCWRHRPENAIEQEIPEPLVEVKTEESIKEEEMATISCDYSAWIDALDATDIEILDLVIEAQSY